MDLHDFESTDLYFDEACPPLVDGLLAEAAEGYASGEAELPLLRAYFLAPQQLSVLVGLYRFYFYQHRLGDADQVAVRAMEIAGQRLGFPDDWQRVSTVALGMAVPRSMGLVRFWLMCLKARAILALREQRLDVAGQMLQALRGLDECDRLGVQPLLDLLESTRAATAEEALAEAA